jgi:hypothetical protein
MIMEKANNALRNFCLMESLAMKGCWYYVLVTGKIISSLAARRRIKGHFHSIKN